MTPIPPEIDIKLLLASPELAFIIRRRLCVAGCLSAVIFILYAVYFFAIAFFPDFMAAHLFANGTASIYVWSTVFMVLFSVFTSACYAWWANKYFDPHKRKLLKALSNEK